MRFWDDLFLSVFFLAAVYNKKYAVPQRTIIGKVNLDGSDTMYPNEHFQEYFPLAVLPEELLEACSSCALGIGAYAVIQKVLEEWQKELVSSLIQEHCNTFETDWAAT